MQSTLRHWERLERRDLLAAGDVFFVSTDGSDSNAGNSAANAWATLQHAADQVGPGETISVLAGNYQGFDLRTSGTELQPITLKAAAGVVIDRVNPRTPDGINVEQASHVVVDGFVLESPSDSTRAGIRVVGDGFGSPNSFSHHVTLRNNTATGWGRWGIFTGFSDDLLIESNTLSASVLEHGIYVSNSGDRPVIRNNHIFDNHANGIHLNGDIHTGDTSLPDVDGVISGAIVDGNIIHGNGVGGGSGINGDGAVDIRISNNLLYDNHASGISLYQIDGGAPSTGGVIVNNTILNATDSRWVINLRDGATGATVFNNILFNFNSSSVRGSIAALEGSEVGLVSDYNLLDPRFSLLDGDQAMGLAEWQSAGNDANSLVLSMAALDSLFRDLGGGDFHPAGGSLSIDFGVSELASRSTPLVDLLGLPRPSGRAVDAGAYEHQAAGSTIFGRADGNWWAAVSTGDRFLTDEWGAWSSSVAWQTVLPGDFNGDGIDDLVGRTNGDWWVARNTGERLITEYWGSWSDDVAWVDVAIADVNGDGRDDIVGRSNGQWWAAISQSTHFAMEYWGRWSNSVTWDDVQVADVDGDGREDVVGRTSGQWWVSQSDGARFTTKYWGSWSNSIPWADVQVADVNGDHRADLVGRTNGQWWVARSTGSQFVNEYWGRWSTTAIWSDVRIGDVNGDGHDDILGRANGQWWVSRSQGTHFAVEYWGHWSIAVAWFDVVAGDFNFDGRDDVAGRTDDGDWWVSLSTGGAFIAERWGHWSPDQIWEDVHPLVVHHSSTFS